MDEATKRKLRRLVLAERLHDVHSQLRQYLEFNPDDEEAAEEWQRLKKGLPMILSLPAAERHRHAAGAAHIKLNCLMAKYPLDKVKHLSASELKELRQTALDLQMILNENGSTLHQDARMYLDSIKSRLWDFKSRSIRFHLKYTVIGLSSFAILVVIWAGLQHAAVTDCESLKNAMIHPLYDNVKEQVRTADTPLNRYFCPGIDADIQQAELWLKHQDERFDELNEQLTRLENGTLKLSFLSSSEILALETGIDQIQRGRAPLQKRWQTICQTEYHALEAQKKTILQELATPLPPLPTWHGNLEEDIKLLSEYKAALLHQRIETEAAIKLYKVTTDAAEKITERIEHAEEILHEIRHLKVTLKGIASARSYGVYCSKIQQLRVKYYTPALNLTAISTHLPDFDTVSHHMVVVRDEYSKELLDAAAAIFTNGAPSFPPDFPANGDIFRIAEDILTAPSLQYKIYTLKLSQTETWYSTIEPELDATNFITYRRSSIDPKFTPENNYREFQNDETYQIGEIDATHLLPELGIERHSLFISGNLPTLLSATLNFKEGKHPALAQACIYLTLLTMTDAHPTPFLSGVRFSPTLRKHAESFKNLLKRHPKISLKPGCWLSDSREVERAEKAFAEWFRSHRGVQYQEEMAKDFALKYCATPQFCGYVDEHGKIKLFEAQVGMELLWYVDKKGIKFGNSKEDMTEALPLSPIFKKKHP